MKRILNLLLLLMATTSSVTAAEDITLSVSDIVFDWGGWGGQANASENSITFPNWANNYWVIDNLSTDEYTRLDMVFAQPVNYYRMVVKAVYSDNGETESVVNYGAMNHSLKFEKNKTLVKIVMFQGDWEGPNKVNGVRRQFHHQDSGHLSQVRHRHGQPAVGFPILCRPHGCGA